MQKKNQGSLRDYGVFLKEQGLSKEIYHFDHIFVSEITAKSKELFILNTHWRHEGELFHLTVHFSRELMEQLLEMGPEENRQVIEDLFNNKYYPITARMAKSFVIHLDAELEEIQQGGFEEYIPLVAKKMGVGLEELLAKIEVALAEKVDIYEEIAVDFFNRVVDMDYENVFITDESSLWDLTLIREEEELVERLAKFYGIDAYSVEEGNLVEIFRLIASKYSNPKILN